MKRLLTLLLSAAVLVVLGSVGLAGAEPSTTCPSHEYINQYPSEYQGYFSEEAQGVAHTSTHWFFTQKDRLWKVPVTSDLAASAFGFPPVGAESVLIGDDLAAPYDHFGDLDQYGGYLFIPVEAEPSSSMPIVAVYRASDLVHVGSADLTLNRAVARNAGWIAIRETEGRVLLYSSSSEVSATKHVFVYEVDMERIAAGDVSESLAEQSPFVIDTQNIPIYGGAAIDKLTTMQGGVFTPYGDFYLASNQGVFLFGPDGSLKAASENRDSGSGFRYQFDDSFGTFEEPEGLDWWDLTNGPSAPSIGGQLHVILLDNDLLTSDDVYIKHYEVDYDCRSLVDSDGDGLFDVEEVEQYKTDPLNADTDGDGLFDGVEVANGTDPLSADTDGDGTLDGEDAFPLDPNENTDTDQDGTGDNADTDDDGDGQLDADEVACGSDPLDDMSMSADFDSDDIPDCVDPDIDGDTVLNDDDVCAFTELPDEPTVRVTGSRFVAASDATFDSANDKFDNMYTLADTQGCSGTQIIELEGLGAGHTKFGISKSALEAFIAGITGG